MSDLFGRMNRAQRRAAMRGKGKRRLGVRELAEQEIRKAGDVVRLVGGPMDNWLVLPTAPALEPLYWERGPYPQWRGGRYKQADADADGTPRAEWTQA